MKHEIRKIGIWSSVKVSFVIWGIVGLLFGAVEALFLLVLSGLTRTYSGPPIAGLYGIEQTSPVLLIIVAPLFFSFFSAVFFGIILTAAVAFAYNLFATLFGGIEVDLRALEPVASLTPESTPAKTEETLSTPHETPSGSTPQAGDHNKIPGDSYE